MSEKQSTSTVGASSVLDVPTTNGQPGKSLYDGPSAAGSSRVARIARVLGPRNIGAVYVWLLIIAFFAVISPSTFLLWQTAQSVLNQNAIAGMVALSLVVPLACGLYDLSVGYTIGLSGICAGWLFLHTGFSRSR